MKDCFVSLMSWEGKEPCIWFDGQEQERLISLDQKTIKLIGCKDGSTIFLSSHAKGRIKLKSLQDDGPNKVVIGLKGNFFSN